MDVQGGQLGAGRWLKDVSFFDEPGDQEHQVHMEGYQVSNQCQALVRDGCLVPTKDAPELGYVRQSTNDVYVPDVYYKVSPTLGLSVPLRSSLLFLFFSTIAGCSFSAWLVAQARNVLPDLWILFF